MSDNKPMNDKKVSQKIARTIVCMELAINEKFVLTHTNVKDICDFLQEIKIQAEENERNIIELSKRKNRTNY